MRKYIFGVSTNRDYSKNVRLCCSVLRHLFKLIIRGNKTSYIQ